MAAKMITGSRSGIRLNVANVAKDAAGFDDLDEFWNVSGRCGTNLGPRLHEPGINLGDSF